MSRTFPSRVQEEYLEALFELSAEGREPVGVVRLAESMAVCRMEKCTCCLIENWSSKRFSQRLRYFNWLGIVNGWLSPPRL